MHAQEKDKTIGSTFFIVGRIYTHAENTDNIYGFFHSFNCTGH